MTLNTTNNNNVQPSSSNQRQSSGDNSDEVTFIRDAFGARTCCTLNSWTVVITFSKMVYSCFLLGLTTFILSLNFISSSFSSHYRSPLFLLTIVPYFIFSVIFSVITSRIFICVASQKSQPDLLSKCIIHFVIYKGMSTVAFLPLLAHYKVTMSPGIEAVVTSLLTWDTTFAMLYVLIVVLYLRQQKKADNLHVATINQVFISPTGTTHSPSSILMNSTDSGAIPSSNSIVIHKGTMV